MSSCPLTHRNGGASFVTRIFVDVSNVKCHDNTRVIQLPTL